MKSGLRVQRAVVDSPDRTLRGFAYGVLLVLLAALAAPVFAHGCHAGDHDDEPLVVPHDERCQH